MAALPVDQFPLLVPGLAMTFCLNFVLAFSVFPSAVMLGDPQDTTHVISIAAYDAAYQEYDYSGFCHRHDHGGRHAGGHLHRAAWPRTALSRILGR
ncbi:hypothetical protein NKG94_50465 [Micromonospora sp. M12]